MLNTLSHAVCSWLRASRTGHDKANRCDQLHPYPTLGDKQRKHELNTRGWTKHVFFRDSNVHWVGT
uniref:Secreted protein n=1 Tax=Heterorhabditis bacteriophora TaxID=37862 RepID=A0A1I7WE51_HETBA